MFLSKFLNNLVNGVSYVVSLSVYGLLLLTLWDIVIFIGGYNYNYCSLVKCGGWQQWYSRSGAIFDVESISLSLLIDFSLLGLFFLSHSLNPPQILKQLVPKHLFRVFYTLCTSLTLECLMCFWVRIPSVTLWECNRDSIRWLFIFVDVFCWISIYSECITVDMLEMSGFKQVYYRSIGMRNPIEMKTERLQTYFKHIRHPGFTGFTVILWCRPVLTLDRLLMAITFSIYMLSRFTVTKVDYQYNRQQVQLKFSAQ
ncbi:hypothetical protein CHUAL_003375 [Chamberlinius hualienensis]